MTSDASEMQPGKQHLLLHNPIQIKHTPLQHTLITTLQCKEGMRLSGNRMVIWIQSMYGRCPLLSADSYPYIIWNILNLLIISFYLFEIGLLIGFGQQFWSFQTSTLAPLNILFLLVMSADIILGPLRSYYQAGVLISDRKLIFATYKRVFWLDALSLIGVATPYFAQSLYFNTFKLLFLARLYRAYEIDQELMVAVQLRTKHVLWFTITRLLLLAVLLSHYLGIAFYLTDYIIYATDYYGPNTPNYCWLYNSKASRALVAQSEWYVLYLYTMYYSIGNITTIAYGDITPLNPLETLLTNALMIASILVFTYFFKSVIQAFFLANTTAQHHNNVLLLVNQLITLHQVDSKVAQGIKAHCQTSFQKKPLLHDIQATKLIDKLPYKIKGKLMKYILPPLINHLHLLTPQPHINLYEYTLLTNLKTKLITHNTPLPYEDAVCYTPSSLQAVVHNHSFTSPLTLHYTYELMHSTTPSYTLLTLSTTELTYLQRTTLTQAKTHANDTQIQLLTLCREQAMACCLCGEKGHTLTQCTYVALCSAKYQSKHKRKHKGNHHALNTIYHLSVKQVGIQKEQSSQIMEGEFFSNEQIFSLDQGYNWSIYKVKENVVAFVQNYNRSGEEQSSRLSLY